VQGHSEELWAIAGHPTDAEFVTAGYDQMVMLWHADTHRLLWKTPVEVLVASLFVRRCEEICLIGPILWGHSGPLYHALSLSLSS